jgi:hypothetical protein
VKTDVLYLCHGRLLFTQESLTNLVANTDWNTVSEFVVYHDASRDEGQTNDFVTSVLDELGFGTLRMTNLQSPVAVMNHFLARTKAEAFAKIDSDIIVPKDWLPTLKQVMEEHPELELLGMEPGMSGMKPGSRKKHKWVPSSHIGGVGLMRVSAFEERPRLVADGRFGFTEFQHDHEPVRGWVQPDLRMFALDQLPFEPWLSLTEQYVREGLNREWGKYDPKMNAYWDWWRT